MSDEIVTIISTGGAAGVLFYVVKWIIDGKLHPHSEVEGLRADVADLKKINAAQAEALRQSNEQQNQILKILQQLPLAAFDRQWDLDQ